MKKLVLSLALAGSVFGYVAAEEVTTSTSTETEVVAQAPVEEPVETTEAA